MNVDQNKILMIRFQLTGLFFFLGQMSVGDFRMGRNREPGSRQAGHSGVGEGFTREVGFF